MTRLFDLSTAHANSDMSAQTREQMTILLAAGLSAYLQTSAKEYFKAPRSLSARAVLGQAIANALVEVLHKDEDPHAAMLMMAQLLVDTATPAQPTEH